MVTWTLVDIFSVKSLCVYACAYNVCLFTCMPVHAHVDIQNAYPISGSELFLLTTVLRKTIDRFFFGSVNSLLHSLTLQDTMGLVP